MDMVTPGGASSEHCGCGQGLGGPETPVVAILVELYGDIKGIMMFVLARSFAQSFCRV